MRRVVFTALLAFALLVPAPASARGTRAVASCANRSIAGFPNAYANRAENIVVGPLSIIRGKGHADSDPASINRFGGDKLPFILRQGHTATVALRRALRPAAGGGWEPAPAGQVHFSWERNVTGFRFVACPRGHKNDSTGDGRPATFWMSTISVVAPVCVYLRVTVDGGRAVRRTMPMGTPDCPRA